jgi:Domain of unknown function (DUF6458)
MVSGLTQEEFMGIGVAVLLIAVGAILTFAVHATLTGISIATVGVILMVAGVIGLVVTLTIFAPRRRMTTVSEERTTADPVTPVTHERLVERHDAY